MVREFGAVGDAVADHARVFDGLGVGARVHFADVGAEWAGEFVDAFVFEGVGGAVFDCLFGLDGGVFFGVEGDGCSCLM